MASCQASRDLNVQGSTVLKEPWSPLEGSDKDLQWGHRPQTSAAFLGTCFRVQTTLFALVVESAGNM